MKSKLEAVVQSCSAKKAFLKISQISQENTSSRVSFLESLQNQNQPPEVFCKKAVLKNFAIFTWKQLCWSLFLIKLQACSFIKKRLQHRCFPKFFNKFSKLFTHFTSQCYLLQKTKVSSKSIWFVFLIYFVVLCKNVNIYLCIREEVFEKFQKNCQESIFQIPIVTNKPLAIVRNVQSRFLTFSWHPPLYEQRFQELET